MSAKRKFIILVVSVLAWGVLFLGLAEMFDYRMLWFIAVLPLILVFGVGMFTDYPKFVNEYINEEIDKHGPVPPWVGILVIIGSICILSWFE